MLFQGFVFGHIEVEIDGRAYDLHSFYQASAINCDVLDRSVMLSFTRRTAPWVPIEEAREITIRFSEVEYFSASGRDAAPIDDDCSVIQSIGAMDPEADTEAFYLTDNIRPDHHLVMRFESGLTLRVQAVEARCEIVF